MVVSQPKVIANASEITFAIKTFNADGSVETLSIPMPGTASFDEWSFVQKVGMLKKGVWNKCSLDEIVFGLAYAKHIGAEVLEGELFPTGNGRWGTSNKYKLKKAFATGRVKGYETTITETGDPLPEAIIKAGTVLKNDIICTVVAEVEGLNKPLKRSQRYSRWFNANNPNWGSKPEHMLELNTLAHALEFLTPGETDEADGGVTIEALPSGAKIPSVAELRSFNPPPAPPHGPPVIEGGLSDPTEIDADALLNSLPAEIGESEKNGPALVKG